jgi:nitrogen fixation NifU-like protein
MQMDSYSAKVIEHAKHPCKFGRISDHDLRFEEVTPLCGDRIRVELRIAGSGVVEEIGFSGEMCAIARASASILFASMEGMTFAAITDLSDEQVLKRLEVPMTSHRVRCALLPVIAFRGAILGGEGRVTSA